MSYKDKKHITFKTNVTNCGYEGEGCFTTKNVSSELKLKNGKLIFDRIKLSRCSAKQRKEAGM